VSYNPREMFILKTWKKKKKGPAHLFNLLLTLEMIGKKKKFSDSKKRKKGFFLYWRKGGEALTA